jgi:hypothetical protein
VLRRAAGCGWSSGFEDDLLAVVPLVLEDVEAAFRLVERQGVGDDPGRVDLPALDALQQRRSIMYPSVDPYGDGYVAQRCARSVMPAVGYADAAGFAVGFAVVECAAAAPMRRTASRKIADEVA